ncbi:beta-galactosidase [Marinococcus halophilus]|uniref:Beta-galactosidase n=1 Tax=Marinococcus halophilus TaxID=1371 RepID=A0A510Y2Z7_MARHA|nr:beta-galactosidase [Marinococcus halophilus]GEK57692.1 beta-galactosidase [Marinococcus halophilus]
MARDYQSIFPKPGTLLHGADYNPEQWLDYPDKLEDDIRLMKEAKCNVMSVGIFSWASLEPEEGTFTFGWLDQILDQFQANGIYAFLASPSGARPAWMSEKYPEVLRVNEHRQRNLHGLRHNHCYTSPVYREKTEQMNTRLAERYAHHPAVIGLHISNEYGGECHCPLCQAAFRKWLKNKYGTLQQLNHDWWTTFWSHTYSSWEQIESPAPHGETMVHGLNLDWKRFVTDQTIDFYEHELRPFREANPKLPATANFMEAFDELDYAKFAKVVDFISWDSYPTWHYAADDTDLAAWVGMNHDWFRAMKDGEPFFLMESTPSTTNWQPLSKLKKPGVHMLSSLQAVAHGSDSVQYFQWRKSRGSSEKFHGSVVDHAGHSETRVFREVAELGQALEAAGELAGTTVQPEVAVIFDTENRWAVKDAQGPRNSGIHYEATVKDHYKAFWKQGVPVDVIGMDKDLSPYKVLVAPMLYMVREGVGEKIAEFVKNGGTLITTYWSGIVDGHDLCFLDGFPGPLREVLGIWSEEIDSLGDGEENTMIKRADVPELGGEYTLTELCDLIHTEGAEVLAAYRDDFYAGRPALTRNRYGGGQAYYIAARPEESFYDDFYASVLRESGVERLVDVPLPHGMTVQKRENNSHQYLFVSNFSEQKQSLTSKKLTGTNLVSGEAVHETLTLPPRGITIIKQSK